MADESWSEIDHASSEKRRELVLKGDLKEKVNGLDGKLPSSLYQLTLLNFLEIHSLEVEELSEELGNLSSLAQFYFRDNLITCLPESICSLTALKILDLSSNAISALPEDFGNLYNLHTLNVCNNQLTELPQSIKDLSCLAVLDLSQNKFSTFPSVLTEGSIAARLAELFISHNDIDDVDDDVEKILLLKVFDASSNKIRELPRSMGKCLKLKQTNFKTNCLKDRRLKKLIEQDSGSSQKAILDYIRSKGRVANAAKNASKNGGDAGGRIVEGGKVKSKGARKKLKGKKAQQDLDYEEELVKYTVEVLKVAKEINGFSEDDPFRVIMTEAAKEVRPFIVCCILKNLDLSGNKMKTFISLQTRLHDEVCGKRTIATIATHDMTHFNGSPLLFDADEPDSFTIQPLGRSNKVTASRFYEKLCDEAESLRKEKKRNQVSGIHKYLTMLKDKDLFAYLCLKNEDLVISLPPLTNCDKTKMAAKQSDIFVEITGVKSLRSCKDILDEMLKQMVQLGFKSFPVQKAGEKDFYDDSSDEESVKPVLEHLIVQQVRVEDPEGNLKVVYPSRTDLDFDSKEIKIIRP